ncbi:hypothetical protein EVA_09290 [gut metagenome]|uniref:Uncharacterized protein n=1 Tax=gut metagenome TaxID=749906 RepID=J9G6X5_9ZZZZ
MGLCLKRHFLLVQFGASFSVLSGRIAFLLAYDSFPVFVLRFPPIFSIASF